MVGPGTTEAQLEFAIALAGRAKVFPSRMKLKRSVDDNSPQKEQRSVQLEFELGEAAEALRLPFETIRPRLAACYNGVELTERLQARLQFGETRAPSSVKIGTGLPQPPPSRVHGVPGGRGYVLL